MNRLIILFIASVFASCSNSGNREETESYRAAGDTIVLTGSSNISDKLDIKTITSRPFKTKITIAGVVKAIPNNYAEVASPFAGRITRSFVRLGQRIKQDDPVFEISSPSYFEAGKTYFRAKQEMQLAEKNFRRQKDLLANGVGIQKDVEEAEVTYESALHDFENAVASLRVFRVKPEELVLGQPLIVRSPIRGEIVDNEIVLGQYLREDDGPVAIVAELSKVWVAGQLKEKDIRAINISDEVEIRPTANPDLLISGKVYHISDILDEETRSVEVFIECDNTSRVLKPGMYVSAQFLNGNGNSILIPASAVFQSEANSFVFVKQGNSSIVRRSVSIASTGRDSVIVKSGLSDGELVVCKGGIILMEAL